METGRNEGETPLQETIEEVVGSDADFEGPARKKQKKKKSSPVGNTTIFIFWAVGGVVD